MFDLKCSKLKADTIAESKDWRLPDISFVHHIKCGDISADNRLVLTGNGTGNLHLWSVADNQQIISPLLLCNDDDDLGGGQVDNSGKAVECCAFSGDSRFILGLVGAVVYIYSVTDTTARSQQELNLPSMPGTRHNHFQTPPHSPRLRRGHFAVQLCRKLVHQFKVYNAVFHSSGSVYYPTVFTSSGKSADYIWEIILIKSYFFADRFIFEWDLDSSKSRGGSFLDFDDDDDDDNLNPTITKSAIKLTKEKRKYSTTLSSQHFRSSHISHL